MSEGEGNTGNDEAGGRKGIEKDVKKRRRNEEKGMNVLREEKKS